MLTRAKVTLDSAMALCLGQRERQEDCIASHFPSGSPFGFAVLADGMGGHAEGDMASKLAVNEVFAGMTFWSDDPAGLEQHLDAALSEALENANAAIARYAAMQPGPCTMGTTLLVPVVIAARLYWLSVGDSPLFLLRQGQLHRLNAEHSLAARLDQQVARGELSPRAALGHPDRQCLTSVLTGAPIPEVECRLAPVALMPGDLVLAASDGLHGLGLRRLEQELVALNGQDARSICAALIAALAATALTDQDNTALCVIRVLPERAPPQGRRPTPSAPSAPQLMPKPTRRRVTLMAKGARATGIHCTHVLEDLT